MDFDQFIENFYSNNDEKKMVLQVDIDKKSASDGSAETNLYDIHCMLFDLFIAGIDKLKLDFVKNLDESASKLQYYYNNINIKLDITSLTKKELIMKESLYENRFIKTCSNDIDKQYVLNGQHTYVDDLSEIYSFYLIDDSNNIRVSFEHADM